MRSQNDITQINFGNRDVTVSIYLKEGVKTWHENGTNLNNGSTWLSSKYLPG